jgi:adenylyltransferase/sulfurtransferase
VLGWWHYQVLQVEKLGHFTYSYDMMQSVPSLNLLPEYKSLIDKGQPHLVLDVWPAHYFQIVSLSGSLNILLSILDEKLPMLETSLTKTTDSSAATLDKQPYL